jgi:hypothetical protein
VEKDGISLSANTHKGFIRLTNFECGSCGKLV